jgi:hypothetical protein
MAECQQEFAYSREVQVDLQTSISSTRLKLFKNRVEDIPSGLQKYLWNARLSKALRFPLEIAEVALRNRIIPCLGDRYQDWPRSQTFRDHAASKTANSLDDALDKVGRGATVDKVVAELSFGFWTAVVSDRFLENLWRGRSARAFPGLPKALLNGAEENQITKIWEWASCAKKFRNDIGHLKPIYADQGALAEGHRDVIRLINACCPTTAKWVESHSTLMKELRAGPKAFVSSVTHRSWKAFRTITSDKQVHELLNELMESEKPYVVVENKEERLLVSAVDVASWIASTKIDGLAELNLPIEGLVKAIPATKYIARTTSVWEARHILSALRSKMDCPVAIITESGKATERPLGLIELADLLDS